MKEPGSRKGISTSVLEFRTGRNLSGKRLLSDENPPNLVNKNYLDEGAHDIIAENLIREYNKIPDVEAGTANDIYPGYLMNIPDAVLDLSNTKEYHRHKWVALEVKTDKGDFQRALYQCTMYSIDGLSPYLVLPEGLYCSIEHRIKRLFGYSEIKTPGLIVLIDIGPSVCCRPDY